MEIYNEINKKKLTIRVISLVFFLFLLNFLAMKFHWYYSIWWFDMPMHFIGGFWLGLLFIWFLRPNIFSLFIILKIILGFIIIAISWEIFEIFVDKLITQKIFNTLDTLSDICFGLSGVFFSIIYFAKRIMIKEKYEI